MSHQFAVEDGDVFRRKQVGEHAIVRDQVEIKPTIKLIDEQNGPRRKRVINKKIVVLRSAKTYQIDARRVDEHHVAQSVALFRHHVLETRGWLKIATLQYTMQTCYVLLWFARASCSGG